MNKSKNTRMSEYLAGLASMLEGAASAVQSIRGILLEKDTVTTKTTNDLIVKAKSAGYDVGYSTAVHNQKTYENQSLTPHAIIGMSAGDLVNEFTVKQIGRNSQTTIFKILGEYAGAIIKVSNKSLRVVEDGRYCARKNDHRLALVSKDADGRNYVNNVIRADLKLKGSSTKIVRYYLPNLQPPYTHCAIYKA